MSDNTKKDAGPALLGALLPSVLQGLRGGGADAGLLAVWDVWQHAVGRDIAENAQPAAFKGGLLIVHVANSVWSHHLQFLKQDMIEQLNAQLGQKRIADIKFTIGSMTNDTAL